MAMDIIWIYAPNNCIDQLPWVHADTYTTNTLIVHYLLSHYLIMWWSNHLSIANRLADWSDVMELLLTIHRIDQLGWWTHTLSLTISSTLPPIPLPLPVTYPCRLCVRRLFVSFICIVIVVVDYKPPLILQTLFSFAIPSRSMDDIGHHCPSALV